MTVVERVRAFNRQWTEVLGLLDQGLLDTEHSLAEARVLFELAGRQSWEQLELRHRLGMDASFLTRVLTRLGDAGLVSTSPSPLDRRRRQVALTARGRSAFDELDARAAAQVKSLVAPLTADQRRRLLGAMSLIDLLLHPGAERTVTVRGLGPGDLGWVIARHGEIYRDEYGWDQDFEGLVAAIVADFHRHFQPGRESAWIAELDGVRAGCVFCCARDEQTAQLRILLVEPLARGRGIGRRLVQECVEFARTAGYRAIVLWTNDVLVSARRIYETAGFRLVDEEPHHSFGHDLVGQRWELSLT